MGEPSEAVRAVKGVISLKLLILYDIFEDKQLKEQGEDGWHRFSDV